MREFSGNAATVFRVNIMRYSMSKIDSVFKNIYTVYCTIKLVHFVLF